ncbi:TPA: hypothetical protein ACH3X1_005965 [Trebouxia sp. C0004]
MTVAICLKLVQDKAESVQTGVQPCFVLIVVAQASEEEGSPLQDDFIALEGYKMPLKVQELSDALDLVPVSKRDCVEHGSV